MPCLERFGLLCIHQYNVVGVLGNQIILRIENQHSDWVFSGNDFFLDLETAELINKVLHQLNKENTLNKAIVTSQVSEFIFPENNS